MPRRAAPAAAPAAAPRAAAARADAAAAAAPAPASSSRPRAERALAPARTTVAAFPAARKPAASSGDAVAEASSARADAGPIEDCVIRTVERYLDGLDGAAPEALHPLVMRAVEGPLIRLALDRCAGNCTAAAALLGITRNTLYKKLLDYGIR